MFIGFEVGFFYDFVGIDDYFSFFYGRILEEIEIRLFFREFLEEFLRRGFVEVGVKVFEDEIRRVVDEFDGIFGWFVEFGFNYWKKGSFEKVIEIIMNRVKVMIKEEFFELEKCFFCYVLILKVILIGFLRWF